MESSIAEFLMRQLASEQLPTSHAREHAARRLACVRHSVTLPSEGTALKSTRRPLNRWLRFFDRKRRY